MTFTWQQLVQAYTVEVIRRVWDEGKHRDNKWLKLIHANWFDIWVEWKTDLAMRDVDRQAEELVEQWDAEESAYDYVFSETLKGDTPLGGEMRVVAPWKVQEGPSERS